MKALLWVLYPLLWLFNIATPHGRAPYFGVAKKLVVGPFTLLEVSAGDWEKLRALTEEICNIEDPLEKHQSLTFMRMQAIASCATNRWGWYLYDPMNKDDLQKVADYPNRLINEALQAIHELNGMPWLVPATQAITEGDGEEAAQVNP